MYYYINILNGLMGGGSDYGTHPGFNAFIFAVKKATGLGFHTIFVQVGPILGALAVLLTYVLVSRLKGHKAGIISAFMMAVTPVAIIRNGQTIAETLAFVFLIAYLYFLYSSLNNLDRKALALLPLFMAIFFIHNLTAALTLYITLVLLVIHLIHHKQYIKASLIILPALVVVAYVYYTPLEDLPQFKEYYLTLYKAIKQYISTTSFGRDAALSWSNYDMVLPAIMIAIPGMMVSYFERKKEDNFMYILFFSLFFLTQAHRINFYFVPYRFLLYLLIPASYFSAIFIIYAYNKLNEVGPSIGILALVSLVFFGAFASSFDFSFNFVMSDEDFMSLQWSRENVPQDSSISTYSKINNKTQNKYTAVSDRDIIFSNSFFNTGVIDFSLLQIASNSFGIPMGMTPPEGHSVYYTSLANEQAGYVKLNKVDRCLTSINIIDTFWGSPEFVGICDGIDYVEGVAVAKDHNLPLILYANERYGEVMDALESWGCSVVLLDDIEVLKRAFDYKGMEYSYGIDDALSYAPIGDAYIFYDAYDPASIEMMVGQYLYLSLEAQTDFPDICAKCDETTMTKLYDAGGTDYYIVIE